MRLKYYLRLIGQMNYKKSFVLLTIGIFAIFSIVIYLMKTITPTIETLCENRAKAIALQVTTQTVKDFLKDAKYSELMNLSYDKAGNLSSLSANVTEMNRVSAEISYKIQEKLEKIESATINIPVGRLLGWSIFSGFGPSLTIKVAPVGNVGANFKTEFVSEGINQTRHTIYIEITTNVITVAPFISNRETFTTSLKVAETIIIGNIPQTYYNLKGLTNEDVMQLIN